jgi:hypothetical protein
MKKLFNFLSNPFVSLFCIGMAITAHYVKDDLLAYHFKDNIPQSTEISKPVNNSTDNYTDEGQMMHGFYAEFDQWVLNSDIEGEGDFLLGTRINYTFDELEYFRRIYEEALRLLEEKGKDEFFEDYGVYQEKYEVYCTDCATYIDIPKTYYNKYYTILLIVKPNSPKGRYWKLDHLSYIYKLGSDTWYSVYQETVSDACDKYCKNRY